MSAITAPAPEPMSMWIITANPSDHPGKHVVRRHEIGAGAMRATDDATVVDDLDAARAAVPAWTVCFPRDPADDPVIVEVWL